MLRLKTTFVLGLIAVALLAALVSYAAPFFLGDSLDGGGPGTTGRGSVWFTDFDNWACDSSLTGDLISDAILDPDDETAVGIQFNAFDSGLQLVVDGSAFNDSDDTGDVVSDAGGRAATLGPELMAGLQVTIEWKALTSTATNANVRHRSERDRSRRHRAAPLGHKPRFRHRDNGSGIQ